MTMNRKGLGKGLGTGYKNLLPTDTHIHSLSAKGVRTKTKVYAYLKTRDLKNRQEGDLVTIPKDKFKKLEKAKLTKFNEGLGLDGVNLSAKTRRWEMENELWRPSYRTQFEPHEIQKIFSMLSDVQETTDMSGLRRVNIIKSFLAGDTEIVPVDEGFSWEFKYKDTGKTCTGDINKRREEYKEFMHTSGLNKVEEAFHKAIGGQLLDVKSYQFTEDLQEGAKSYDITYLKGHTDYDVFHLNIKEDGDVWWQDFSHNTKLGNIHDIDGMSKKIKSLAEKNLLNSLVLKKEGKE